MPPGIGAIKYIFYQGDTAEFTPLPPLASQLGTRSLRITGNVTMPVDVFGQARFMVERAHPNADGHAIIARLVADRAEELPSFHDWVQAARPEAAGP